MPWKVRKRKSKYCVEKTDGGEVAGGCHDTNAEAQAHMRALYASEKGGAIVSGFMMRELMLEPMAQAMSSGGSTVNPMRAAVSLTWNDRTVDLSPGSYTVITAASSTNGDETSSNTTDTSEVNAIEGVKWQGILAYEGLTTDDRRLLMKDQIEHRELPLSIMYQDETAEGHGGARLAARVDEIWWVESEGNEGAMEIWGRGVFADNPAGHEAVRMIEGQFLKGISVDLAPTDYFLLDPDTLEEVDTDEMDMFEALLGDYVTGMAGSIMGATFVPFAAFADATVEVITAGGSWTLERDEKEALTASGADMAPLAPPKAWFEMPEANGPTPLTVTDDGRVFGHLATWNECHSGFRQECVLAPRSRSGYSAFHLGELRTEEGDKVSVGRITVGQKGHAPIHLSADAVRQYYDETGCVAAFVRATDGRHGIWLSGAVRSDAPAEKVRDMMANPPSGDWRNAGGGLELQGVLSVPIPGYPVPRHEYHLVASGADGAEEIVSLVQAGYGSEPMGPREFARKKRVLVSRLESMGIRRKPRTREEMRRAGLPR